jgi:DNA-binding NarL/FixJ family response regulator
MLLLDLRIPKKDGLEVIRDLMSRTPKPRIIVMTAYQATETIRPALTAGAKGYLLKEAEPAQLWDTVRRVFAGDVVLPPGVSAKLAASLAQPELSPRETQVLRQLCAGDSNKDIAQKIHLSESSVKFYTKHVYKKLGAAGRTAAMAIAMRRGLVGII